MDGTLLLIEDDPTTCKLLRLILAEAGLEVITARTVAEGLARLDPCPEYLVLDLTLPDGDGQEVLEKLREAGLPTRVAVTSGWADLGALERLQPDVVFRKPIDPGDLIGWLNDAAWCSGPGPAG